MGIPISISFFKWIGKVMPNLTTSRTGILALVSTFMLVLLVTWAIVRREGPISENAGAALPGKWCLENDRFELRFLPDMTYEIYSKDSVYNLNDSGRTWRISENIEGQEVVLKRFRKRLATNEYADWHMPLIAKSGGPAIVFETDPERLLRRCN
jgi:hypothetical protein